MLRCLMIWFLLMGLVVSAQAVPTETETPVTILAPSANLAQGVARFEQGDMFGAESQFLGVTPSPTNRVMLARYLSAVAMRSDAVTVKRAFFEANLARDPEWRAMALLVLCHLTVAQEDWPEFQRFAVLYLNENTALADDPRWFLLYALARFTAVEPPDLQLDQTELRWFLVSRQTPTERAFPLSAPAGLPYFWRYGALLEQSQPFEVPQFGGDPADRDLILYQMLEIKAALNRDDANSAAVKINQMKRDQFSKVDTHLKIHYADLLAAFYRKRNKADALEKVLSNRKIYRKWALLPVVPRPEAAQAGEALRTRREHEQAEQQVLAEQRAKAEQAAQAEQEAQGDNQGEATSKMGQAAESPNPPADPTPQTETPSKGWAWLQDLETRVPLGLDTVKEALRAFEAETAAQQHYRDYLLGLWFLEKRQTEEAAVFLNKALDGVLELPLPALESQVRVALARNYDLLGNTDRRDWHFLRAVEIWKTPENLPLLSLTQLGIPHNPLATMVDRKLAQNLDTDAVGELFYHGELAHLLTLRGRALQRKALSRNQVLDHQLHQVGGQLAAMVDDMMKFANHGASPRRFNQTLAIWTQLWDQVQPTYRNTEFNNLAQVQQSLNQRDRILYFIEGRQRLGLLVLSKTQAFGVALGSLSDFHAMDTARQLQFLEGRLGPVWNHHGPVLIKPSSSLLHGDFLEKLKERCINPERLSFHFSLRDFTAAYVQKECDNFAVVVAEESEILEAWSGTVPAKERQIWTAEEWQADRGYERFEWADRILYQGDLEHHAEGLYFGGYTEGLALHRLIHLNLSLCSMALVSKDIDHWGTVFGELELLDPSGRIAFDLYRKLPTRLPQDPRARGGVRFDP